MPLYMSPFACGCSCVPVGQILRCGISRLKDIHILGGGGCGGDLCMFAVLDIANILALKCLLYLSIHLPSLGLFIPSCTSVLLLGSSLAWELPLV